MPTAEEIRVFDGPGLTKLAWEMHLDPRGLGDCRLFSWQQRFWGEAAMNVDGNIWRPHERIDQADAVFRQLRARGWTTSCCWFADDRQHGDVFAAGQGRAVGVHWPRDVPSEALALLLVACLARASEGDPHEAQR